MVISLDIQEKTIWQETSANLFIKKLYLNEKFDALTLKEYDFENFFSKNEDMLLEVLQDIKKINLDDISLIPKISTNWGSLKQRFSNNLKEILKLSDRFKAVEEQSEIETYRSYLRGRISCSYDEDLPSLYSYSLFLSK